MQVPPPPPETKELQMKTEEERTKQHEESIAGTKWGQLYADKFSTLQTAHQGGSNLSASLDNAAASQMTVKKETELTEDTKEANAGSNAMDVDDEARVTSNASEAHAATSQMNVDWGEPPEMDQEKTHDEEDISRHQNRVPNLFLAFPTTEIVCQGHLHRPVVL